MSSVLLAPPRCSACLARVNLWILPVDVSSRSPSVAALGERLWVVLVFGSKRQILPSRDVRMPI